MHEILYTLDEKSCDYCCLKIGLKMGVVQFKFQVHKMSLSVGKVSILWRLNEENSDLSLK